MSLMSTRRAVIIGGSLGGLMAGLMLRRQGWDVAIHERTPVPLSGRGAGLTSHDLLMAALEAAGISEPLSSLGITVHERRVFGRDGTVIAARHHPQLLTSWDRLFQLLRAAFPDGAYHLNRSFVGVAQTDDTITARFADGSEVEADLLIAADGFRSSVRGVLLPKSDPSYAGYIAWRGMVHEQAVGAATHRALFGSFAFCLPEGEQMLGYPVAGPRNDLSPGNRRYNFVWYRPASETEGLPDLLTDSAGIVHPLSIPPPLIRTDVIAAMREAAERSLSPQFAEIIRLTDAPFFQPIYDYAAPRLAFGRAVLMGDAAFVARPHVGAGVAKAGADAMTLAAALDRHATVVAALAAYEAERLPQGNRTIARARELGAYMQAQQFSEADNRHAATLRNPEALLEHTANLAFLDERPR
jgi:2-polyprenyl-6-methoxyphenol hydroxylase-like FAD-dependent oxidoreductase